MNLSYESRLTRLLIRRYKKAGRIPRPVLNSTETMRVEFGFALVQILDFDETNQVLSTNMWKRYRWKDALLTWDPDDYGGITDIRLSAMDIWVPDIVLYNNANTQEKKHEELLAVYHDGYVRWIPPAIYKSSCQLFISNFPFDEQTCHFKFGSWTYDGHKLELAFFDQLNNIDLREYINNSEFDVLSTSAELHVSVYPCCGDDIYPDLTFYITMRRKVAFHIYVLILPCHKLWGMSLFSSFFVLLLILVQSSPPTSASISLLEGVYYCINMVLIVLSTMLSAVVINLTHYVHKKRVPKVAKVLFVDILGRVLCAKGTSEQAAERKKEDIRVEEAAAAFLDLRRGGGGGGSDGHMRTTKLNGRLKLANNTDPPKLWTSEWRVLASVIDRLFFLLYVVGIILSFIFVFPR